MVEHSPQILASEEKAATFQFFKDQEDKVPLGPCPPVHTPPVKLLDLKNSQKYIISSFRTLKIDAGFGVLLDWHHSTEN